MRSHDLLDVRAERTDAGIVITVPSAGAIETELESSDITHSPDFTAVVFRGEHYAFTRKQAAVVRVLIEARNKGYHSVRQEVLLRAADSYQPHLRELLRNHPAWGVLIVKGGSAGQYRIAP